MKNVSVHYDYASPWAFIATEIAERKLPGVPLTWVPTYLRGLESFATGVPYTSAKLTYITRDLVRVAEHEKVNLQPPANFPVDGLSTLRAAIVAQERGAFERYHRAAFRATWSEQRDVSNRAVAAALLAEAIGSTAAEAEAAMADAAIKTKLRENTERAAARGVFGVPTFFVGDDMFWGHDRMDYVLRAASS
jgi:2-hydroxychromene-2-carboxylate isomerase